MCSSRPSSSRKWPFEAYEPDQTEEQPKEKTRSFKGDDGVSYVSGTATGCPARRRKMMEEVPEESPVAEPN